MTLSAEAGNGGGDADRWRGVVADLAEAMAAESAADQVDAWERRIEQIHADLGQHGDLYRPYSLGNLLREFGEALVASDSVAAIRWAEVAVDVWRACEAMAPTAQNSGNRQRAEAALAAAQRAASSVTGAAHDTTEAPALRPEEARSRTDPLAFLRRPENTQGDDAFTAFVAALGEGGGKEVQALLERVDDVVQRVKLRASASDDIAALVVPVLEEDRSRLAELAGNAPLPGEAQQLKQLAQHARGAATPRDLQPTDQLPRLWWLIAAAANLHLVEGPHQWTASAPHVIVDELGYLSALGIQHRYDDNARDFLAANAELLVRVASQLPPAFEAAIARWCRSSVGLYLLLRGPSPALPSSTMYDERVRGIDRAEWAGRLLDRYKNGQTEETVTASVALAQVAGEDAGRLEWVLQLLYGTRSEGPDAADLAFWLSRGVAFVERTARLRVVANPWAERDAGGVTQLSTVTARRAADGSILIPSKLLQHATAEMVANDEAVTINGSKFKGRRVPTYLLRDASGPSGLLKIDHADKIQREYDNFRTAAKQLHHVNRPGTSDRGNLTIYLADDGTALRAIITSHVFGPDDEPTTLADWLGPSDPHAAAQVVERLFCSALRPWVAFVARERVDLRMEYPVLRPRTPQRSGYAPKHSGASELDRIKRAEPWAGSPVGEASDGLVGLVPARLGAEISELVTDRLIDPVWLASHLAEVVPTPDPRAAELIDEFVDYETLVSRCHGDLHAENVLCLEPTSEKPRLVVIDFESTHSGHVCKDFARLEAAVLAQHVDWGEDDRRAIVRWFLSEPVGGEEWGIAADDLPSGEAAVAIAVARQAREVAFRCGQQQWPVSSREYGVALLGALLPIARYTTVSERQRALAMALAGVVAAELYQAS